MKFLFGVVVTVSALLLAYGFHTDAFTPWSWPVFAAGLAAGWPVALLSGYAVVGILVTRR